MYKIFKDLILTIVPILIISCNNGTITNNNMPITSSYLVKPTGPYEVGFEDYHYININVCPDVNYIPNVNESYFSPGNQGGIGTNFCHEIMVRIYYPTNIPFVKETDNLYYPVMTQQLQEQLIQTDPSLTSDQLQTLNTLFSYTIESIPIANSQFPVILFNPGYGLPSQLYENLITQLVSNGYIVISINSVLVSGNIQLPNGVITPVVYPLSESAALADYNEALSDLKFIYNEMINTSSNISDPIFTKFNLSQIGALAHSMGALAIANGAEQNPTWFKAVIPLDMALSNPAFTSLGIPLVTNPVLYQFSNAIYSEIESLGIVIPLAESTSYSLLISPSIENNFYSAHGNFTDFSTLQYMPVYQQAIDYIGGAWNFGLGLGNGIDITNAININVIQFFNTYLKNQPNNVFNTDNCLPISANTLIQCGPGSI